MSRRSIATFRATSVALCALLATSLLAACAVAAPARPLARAVSPARTGAPARDTAIFAGGCFWSMEAAFEGQPGVLAAVSGYSGGHTANPTYDEVTTETTGHRETVEVTFDPAKTTYDRLLDVYWHSTNPIQADGQFCDHGDSYRPAIFYRTTAQKNAALASKQSIDASGVLRAPIVTEIRPAMRFYPAEGYHQDYARRNHEAYMEYRLGCGKDRALDALWGKLAQHHID
jgi:peptide-methionine (S)-S-oxide reductase